MVEPHSSVKRLKRAYEGDLVVVWAQTDQVRDVCEVVLVWSFRKWRTGSRCEASVVLVF